MAETFAPAAAEQATHTATAHQPRAHAQKEVKRQIVSFQFFQVMPEWRRLPAAERAAHKQAFTQVIERWQAKDKFVTITYSTLGAATAIWRCGASATPWMRSTR
jgi:hypothetical protein